MSLDESYEEALRERDEYREALKLIASGTIGPALMRMTACEVLGLEPPVWTAEAE